MDRSNFIEMFKKKENYIFYKVKIRLCNMKFY